MTPEHCVAAYITACHQRKLRWKQLQGMGKGFMHGWDEIEQLGREIEALHWTRSKDWPGASSCGWGSDEEKESEYVRTYKMVELGDGMAEVIVECHYGGQLKDKIVYRLRFEEGDWRIENEFEIGSETPTWEHCENPEVKQIHTAPRLLHLGTICPAMDGLMKPAIRLHAVRDETVTAFDSHMAGPFLANDPKIWPRCEQHQTPLLGGLQLWRRDLLVPPVAVQGELFADICIPSAEVTGREFPQGSDVLQVFWCPFYHPYDQSSHHLRWLDSSQANASLSSNPAYRQPPQCGGMVPRPCRLHSERHPDYPALWEARVLAGWPDLCRELQARMEQGTVRRSSEDYDEYRPKQCINSFYSENLGSVDGTKWGGYPCWIQDPQVPTCECGTPMQHLLTVASSCDPTLGSPPVIVESRLPVRWDADLCMGDVGSVYYFICPKCPGGTRYEAVFQCS